MSTAVGVISLIVGLASFVITAVLLATIEEPDVSNAKPDPEAGEFPAYSEGTPIPVVYGIVQLNGTIIYIQKNVRKEVWPHPFEPGKYNESEEEYIYGNVLLALCHGRINFLSEWDHTNSDWALGWPALPYEPSSEGVMRTIGINGTKRTYGSLFHYWFGDLIPDPGNDTELGSGFYPAAINFQFYKSNDTIESYTADVSTLDSSQVDTIDRTESKVINQSPLYRIAKIYLRNIFMQNGTFPRFKIPVARNLDFNALYPELVFYSIWDSSTYGTGIRGTAPATIIYDLLVNKKYGLQIDTAEIDVVSFNAANLYYASLQWGLSMLLNSDRDARSVIEDIELLVGCKLRLDNDGKYSLKHFTPDDVPEATIIDSDIVSFKMSRQTWDETYNDFRAKAYSRHMTAHFWDTETAYSEDSETDGHTFDPEEFVTRMVSIKNSANINITGNIRVKEYDLRAFGNFDLASKRLYEIMKVESTPKAKASLSTNMEFVYVNEGDILRYQSDEYGVTLNFRVLSKTINEKDENILEFNLIEEIFYIASQYIVTGENFAEDEAFPTEIADIKILELPYIKTSLPYLKQSIAIEENSSPPIYAVLIPKPKNCSIFGCGLYISPDNADYELEKSINSFCLYGTLQEEYILDTYNIDDTYGVLFSFGVNTGAMKIFDNLSRANLFNNRRLALIDNEIITFQTMTDEGGGNFRLNGIIRGLIWTTKAVHTNGSGIYFFGEKANTSDIFIQPTIKNFYVKPVPFTSKGKIMEIGDVTGISVSTNNVSATPQKPRLKATRSGSDVTIEIFPVSYFFDNGAGYLPNRETSGDDPFTDSEVFAYIGSFTYQKDAGSDITTGAQEVVISDANAFIITLIHELSGFKSTVTTINIGTNDGAYYGD